MDAVRRPRFTRTRYRPGYAISDVEALVDRIEETLGVRPRSGPAATADEVNKARFRVVRLRRGYDMREVDDALDQYEEELRQLGWP